MRKGGEDAVASWSGQRSSSHGWLGLAGRAAQSSSGCPGAVRESDRGFTWSRALVEGQGDSCEPANLPDIHSHTEQTFQHSSALMPRLCAAPAVLWAATNQHRVLMLLPKEYMLLEAERLEIKQNSHLP